MDSAPESTVPQSGVNVRPPEAVASASAAADKRGTGKPKISVKDLNFFYGAFKALHDINIEIPENRITALIGPSGCGKITFLRTLNRINEMVRHARAEGSVTVDGENVMDVDVTSLRRRVGMVFQRPNPFPEIHFR